MCIRIVVLGLFLSCCFLQGLTETNAQQTEAKKVLMEPEKEPDNRGKARFTDYELVFPVIDSHQYASLMVAGKNVQWSQKFVDGAEPFFNALEEEFEPGVYVYQICYQPNELGESEIRYANAFKNRRELLKKRLELMEKGDREGAKSLLEEANAIRDGLVSYEKNDRPTVNGTDEDFISKTGQFSVSDDGQIKEFSLKKELAAAAEQELDAEKERMESGEAEEETETGSDF
jgi:hypothetical protein